MSEQTADAFHPFKNIALALSGGGFRAASYSLGTLSYLEHLKYDPVPGSNILNNVTFISSASGGTIASCLYSYYRHTGKSFTECYKKLMQSVLPGEDLLDRVLKKLQDDTEWDQPGNPKKRNLINSFAKAYDEIIFDGKSFEVFSTGKEKNLEVCFNSTEFTRGLQFRFQTDGSDDNFEVTGNYYIHFSPRHKDVLNKIKLGDILAASSCFPGGFEPIIYPEDFSYQKNGTVLTPQELRKDMVITDYKNREEPLEAGEIIGLMDGGITDNQGLDSAMLADKRRRTRGNGFDLILVTDVTSYFMDPYEVPPEKEALGWRQFTLEGLRKKLKKVFTTINLAVTLSVLLLLASLAGAFFAASPLLKNISLVMTGFFATIVLARILLWVFVLRKNKTLHTIMKNPEALDIVGFLKNKLPAIKNFSPPIGDKLIHYFSNTKLGVLEQMLLARVNSVLTMISDVFLKHIRRKIFGYFYDNELLENRRCDNFIYELSRNNETARQQRLKRLKWPADTVALLSPTTPLMDIAQVARNTGTTLWFDINDSKEEKLKLLVACGQFTCCVKLLEYCIDLEIKMNAREEPLVLSEEDKKVLAGIRRQLETDWKKFKTDPYFLYDQYAKQITAI